MRARLLCWLPDAGRPCVAYNSDIRDLLLEGSNRVSLTIRNSVLEFANHVGRIYPTKGSINISSSHCRFDRVGLPISSTNSSLVLTKQVSIPRLSLRKSTVSGHTKVLQKLIDSIVDGHTQLTTDDVSSIGDKLAVDVQLQAERLRTRQHMRDCGVRRIVAAQHLSEQSNDVGGDDD